MLLVILMVTFLVIVWEVGDIRLIHTDYSESGSLLGGSLLLCQGGCSDSDGGRILEGVWQIFPQFRGLGLD